jgi:uncharacterized membrane protein HdeD (DUF308 family)
MNELHRPSLIFGVLFLVAGLVFLLDEFDVISLSMEVFLPLVLVLVGIALIVGAVGPFRQGPAK